MIMQSLVALYDRLAKNDIVPPFGFSIEDIGFVINIDIDGKMIGEPEDLRTKTAANRFDYRSSVVPYTNEVNVRAGGKAKKTPNFLVDKADYVFGMSGTTEKSTHHECFKQLIYAVCENSTDLGYQAVRRFFEQWQPADAINLEYWNEICGTHGKWIAFKLKGDSVFVHERPEIRELWQNYLSKQEYPTGISLLDGCIHKLQPQFAQFRFGSGASLVSFNENVFESYGKKRGENAPLSVESEFKSSTALKHLFRSKKQRLYIGGTITVFWTERESAAESIMGMILNPGVQDEADARRINAFLQNVRDGTMPGEVETEGDMKFYIVGLSLNKARLALRFWYVSTVKKLMTRLQDHFSNLEMEKSSERDIPFPGIWHLIRETARDSDDISPVLGGAVTRSILTGQDYPHSLYLGVLGRIRAEQAKKNPNTGHPLTNVSYLRASILKAVLSRNQKMEVPMTLDTERSEIAYLLGRLFAVLEKAQLDALGRVNATIKDRFFSSASATPASVFPRLLRLSQHHIEKADYGYISDRRIAEIMEHIDAFPKHMNLNDQGLFAIAYYQQKNALYRKAEQKSEGEKDE